MQIDGRGQDVSVSYERLKHVLTKEGCTLEDFIEVLVDSEGSAKKINVLASLVGYETTISRTTDGWSLRVDTRRRRCT